MFSLDSHLRSHSFSNVPSAGPEGESDNNPIRLQGDLADDFRALLWALYALFVNFDFHHCLCLTIRQTSRINGCFDPQSQ